MLIHARAAGWFSKRFGLFRKQIESLPLSEFIFKLADFFTAIELKNILIVEVDHKTVYFDKNEKETHDLGLAVYQRLHSGEVSRMRSFGMVLDRGLRDARVQPEGYATWEEEDYCTPPLAQERKAVLDTYFSNLTVEGVGELGR